MSKTHTDSDSGTDAEAKSETGASAGGDASTGAEAETDTNADADAGTGAADAGARGASVGDSPGAGAGTAGASSAGASGASDASASGAGADGQADAGAGGDADGGAGAGPGARRDTQTLSPVTEAEAPDDNELPARLEATAPRQWRNRATPWLFAAVLLAGGFLGGVQVQKTWGKPATTSSGASQGGIGGQAPAFTPPSGFSGGGGFRTGGGSQETTGTLKSVTASALTIRTADGKTRTVKIAESTRIQQSVTIGKLKPGRPVTVAGSTAADGTVTATAVTVS